MFWERRWTLINPVQLIGPFISPVSACNDSSPARGSFATWSRCAKAGTASVRRRQTERTTNMAWGRRRQRARCRAVGIARHWRGGKKLIYRHRLQVEQCTLVVEQASDIHTHAREGFVLPYKLVKQCANDMQCRHRDENSRDNGMHLVRSILQNAMRERSTGAAEHAGK